MSFKVVQVPADAGLARLLRGAPVPGSSHHVTHRHLGVLANAADPKDQMQTAHFPASLAGAVADDLGRILARAREQADPAADVLAAFLAREFGRTEATA
jgi:hypothetical protein